MKSTMRALVLQKTGQKDAHRNHQRVVHDMPIPEPQEGEIRVRVHACGLNPVDYKLADHGIASFQLPHILGLDVAGVVDKIGPNTETSFKVGDAVYYHGDLNKRGGFAEYACVLAHTVAPLPKNLSFEQAAAIPCAGFTAYQALIRKIGIQNENRHSLLITGAAGGVGTFAVQIAACFKPRLHTIIATCSKKNFDYMMKLGATHVIDYTSEDINKKVMEITGNKGVDAILDTIGSESATKCLALLKYNGSIATIAGVANTSSIYFTPFNGNNILDIALGGAYVSDDLSLQRDLAQMGIEMGELASQGKIVIDPKVVTLEQVPEALFNISQRHVVGKIVAKII